MKELQKFIRYQCLSDMRGAKPFHLKKKNLWRMISYRIICLYYFQKKIKIKRTWGRSSKSILGRMRSSSVMMLTSFLKIKARLCCTGNYRWEEAENFKKRDTWISMRGSCVLEGKKQRHTVRSASWGHAWQKNNKQAVSQFVGCRNEQKRREL